MEILVAVLVFALILSNGLWLLYMDRNSQRQREERRELHNRIAEPELIIDDPVPLPEDPNREFNEASALTPEEQAEFAAVGMVDPDLMRQTDN